VLVRRSLRPAERATALADKLERHTSTALAAGAGLGAVGGFNQAAISRAEAGAKAKRPAGVHKAERGAMMISAFGIEHGTGSVAKGFSPKDFRIGYNGAKVIRHGTRLDRLVPTPDVLEAAGERRLAQEARSQLREHSPSTRLGLHVGEHSGAYTAGAGAVAGGGAVAAAGRRRKPAKRRPAPRKRAQHR
jgi:hypothetical protein